MSYTLTTAATACGLNRSTIFRAIKAGKVSATKNQNGEWSVEPSELHRCFPPIAAPGSTPDAPQRDAAPDAAALAEANQRALTAEQSLCQLRGMLDDMRGERDAWRDQAQRLAIPDQRPRSWWRRLAG